MKMAMLQTAGDRENRPAANLQLLDSAASAAADQGAELLLAPEMFLSGYNIGRDAARAVAEPFDGPSAQRVSDIARRLGIAICYGYPELGEDGAVYNSALIIGKDGTRLLNYRKAHLFGELDRSMFSAGDGKIELAEIGGLKMGMLICYDVEFPEAVRALALVGADLVLVATANMKPYDAVSLVVVPTRAYENELFVAYANRCGAEGQLEYMGLSCVGDPYGGNLVIGGEGEELIFAEIDPARLAASRRYNTHLPDRRPELYRTLVPEG